MYKFVTVLAAALALSAPAFTPPANTNSYTESGVTYAQKGGIANSNYVVTAVNPSVLGAVKSVNAKTGDVVLSASDVGAADRTAPVTNYTAAAGTTNDIWVSSLDGVVLRWNRNRWSGEGPNVGGLVSSADVTHVLASVRYEVYQYWNGTYAVAQQDPDTAEYLCIPVTIGGSPDGVFLDWDTVPTNDVLVGRFDDESLGVHVGPYYLRRYGGVSVSQSRAAYMSDVEAAAGAKQDTLPYPTNAIPYSALTGTPPPPGNYAAVSNAAMNAAQRSDLENLASLEDLAAATNGLPWIQESLNYPHVARFAEDAYHADSASYAEHATYSDWTLSLAGETRPSRFGDAIFSQLDAATSTNAAQTAAIEAMPGTVSNIVTKAYVEDLGVSSAPELDDEVRHCTWVQAVTNGVFYWYVKEE